MPTQVVIGLQPFPARDARIYYDTMKCKMNHLAAHDGECSEIGNKKFSQASEREKSLLCSYVAYDTALMVLADALQTKGCVEVVDIIRFNLSFSIGNSQKLKANSLPRDEKSFYRRYGLIILAPV